MAGFLFVAVCLQEANYPGGRFLLGTFSSVADCLGGILSQRILSPAAGYQRWQIRGLDIIFGRIVPGHIDLIN